MNKEYNHTVNNDGTITWNTANRPRTGKILSESEQGYLVETDEGRCVFISKYVSRPRIQQTARP